MKPTARTQWSVWKARLVKVWGLIKKWLGRLIDTTGKI